VLSQLKIVIRTNYSNPPTHGGAVVATVLGDATLRAQWEQELAGMRTRIKPRSWWRA
jgi:aromatic-amino-acid transaminase